MLEIEGSQVVLIACKMRVLELLVLVVNILKVLVARVARFLLIDRVVVAKVRIRSDHTRQILVVDDRRRSLVSVTAAPS